jgi:mannosyltransferase OCH1-like enzyme
MIPRLVHQIWIGKNDPPQKLMNAWKERAFSTPGWEYVLWSENSRKWTSQSLIDQIGSATSWETTRMARDRA